MINDQKPGGNRIKITFPGRALQLISSLTFELLRLSKIREKKIGRIILIIKLPRETSVFLIIIIMFTYKYSYL